MILHATATAVSKGRTLCGLKLERGVHRCGVDWLSAHVDGREDVEACPACQYVALGHGEQLGLAI